MKINLVNTPIITHARVNFFPRNKKLNIEPKDQVGPIGPIGQGPCPPGESGSTGPIGLTGPNPSPKEILRRLRARRGDNVQSKKFEL